jgi:hypothetical protein
MKDQPNESMMDTEKRSAAIRMIAENARTVWRRLDTMPPAQLTKIYLAFSEVGDEFDKDCRYREKILSLLPDYWLLIGDFTVVKMPIKLIKIIEDRLRPPPPLDPNSFDFGSAMVTPGPDC